MTKLRSGWLLVLLCMAAACDTHTQTTGSYGLGGQVYGLSGTLVLANGQSLLPVTASGSFSFPDPVSTGEVFTVRVYAQPGGQQCTVHNGVDVMANQNVTGIIVTCAQNLYKLGGSLSGLVGAPGDVTLSNGNDRIVMNGAGTFVFPTGVAYNSSSAVQVVQSPNNWTCQVTQASGPVVQDTNSVQVTCSPSFSVGGPISNAVDSMILANNGVLLTVPVGQATYAFTGQLAGSNYAISVVRQPSGQACAVSNPNGTVVSSSVINANITCGTATYTLTGSITGNANGTIINNLGSAPLTLNSGSNVFVLGGLHNGQSYNLAVTPAVGQACSLRGPSSGVIDSANVQGVQITCSNQALYQVGGSVTGATDSVVLTNNATSPSTTVTVPLNNPNFAFQVYGGARYNVAVTTAPAGQICDVVNGSGQVSQSNILNLQIRCYALNISGTIVGDSNGLIIKARQNGTLRRIPVAGGSTTFNIPGWLPNDQFSVGVYASSAGNRCTASGNTSGTVQNANIVGPKITCQPRTYSLGFKPGGLDGGDYVTVRVHEQPSISVFADHSVDVAVLTGLPNNSTATLEIDPANSSLNGKTCAFYPNAVWNVHNASISTLAMNCSANQPPGTQTYNTSAPRYDFETSTQGWNTVLNSTQAGTSVVGGALPTGPIYHGAGALEVAYTHPSDGSCGGGAGANSGELGGQASVLSDNSPAAPFAKPGYFVSYYFWYPADLPLKFVQAFFYGNRPNDYHDDYVATDTVLEPDTWVNIVTWVPDTETSWTNIGVSACATADYTGSYFVDSVDYQLP